MRHIILFSFLFISSFAFGQGIDFFHGTWEEGLAKAKTEGKILFVDAYAEWCGPCKRMAANTFPDEAVGEFFNKHFVSMKMDMEKTESTEFRRTHNASAYPTLLFIDYDDSEIHKKVGALDAAGLIAQGKTAMSKIDRTADYAPLYEAGDRSPELVLNYVKSLNQAGKPALKIVNDYVNAKPDFSDEKNLLILFEGTVQADSRIFSMMTKYEKQITAIVGKPAVDEKITNACKATVATAVEFKSSDLLVEAQEKCKKYVPSAFSKFELESNKEYALATKNAKLYIKSAKGLADDKSLDERARQMMLHSLIKESMNVFKKDEKVLKLAESYADNLVKIDDNYGNRYTLANVQYTYGNYKAAKTNAITALGQAKAKKVGTRSIEILIKKIEERS